VIPLARAQETVLAGCPTNPAVAVDLDDALGLVLAEAVVAPEDVPPFANTAMDGYAVVAGDLTTASAGLVGHPARTVSWARARGITVGSLSDHCRI
jgi:molybdopterin molybdotransferase